MGRLLKPGEQVHHINMQKRDNRPENLAVISKSDHSRVHKYLERVAVYMCGLSPIRPEALDFGAPVFWAEKWVTFIDLIGERKPLSQPLIGESVSEKSETVN
jgi:hypothetical protein